MDDVTARICDFIETIGIPVRIEPIAHDTVLPGIDIRNGSLVLDPSKRYWPGDLLHEAGHIAVTAPELRATLCKVPSDGGEEMATIAWSYAASLAIGLDPATVFHDDGYHGNGAAFVEAFSNGQYFGVPLLQWWGMTAEKGKAGLKHAAFPHMHRWLR